MSGKYNIVEKLEVYEANFAHDGRMGLSEDMTMARELIQELGEALSEARPFLSAGAWRGDPDEVAMKIDAILSKLKGA